MNIRHLYIFKAVCEEMNFTRAAEKLYMTQPAVSHVINDLEEETGHILFDRISKKIYLTEMGKIFLNNDIDVALIEGGIHNDYLIKTVFSSYELSVICSSNHPFSKKKCISIEEFIKEDLLLREKGSAIRDCLDNALAGKDVFAAPSWTSTNSQALIQGVKNNLGITVLPDILVANELERKELKKLFIKDINLKNNNYIVYHKDKFISNTMSVFIDSVKKINLK